MVSRQGQHSGHQLLPIRANREGHLLVGTGNRKRGDDADRAIRCHPPDGALAINDVHGAGGHLSFEFQDRGCITEYRQDARRECCLGFGVAVLPGDGYCVVDGSGNGFERCRFQRLAVPRFEDGKQGRLGR